MSAAVSSIFVYGTLKRGEVREKCWPLPPLKIESATLRGLLYDLGPHPALVEGSDIVAGELWHFGPQDMPATLAVLDKVEGYRGKSDDWYRRVIVACQVAGGTVAAWTYLHARVGELSDSQRVMPDERGVCDWSKPR